MKISVVIVKYRSDKYLSKCLQSVKQENPYEIIVVDNDKENRGYGGGCNYGAKKAKGDYLLFLNPDTELCPQSLVTMSEYLAKNNNVAVVGPKLYKDKDKKIPQLSSCMFPNFITALAVYGRFRKLWPGNPLGKLFVYHKQLKTNMPISVDVVSGAALMVRANIFKQVGGFDENYFLYFEENDLCRRIKKLGYQITFLPMASVIHYGGGSTLPGKDIDDIFNSSRKLFFSKHYSKLQAYIVNNILK